MKQEKEMVKIQVLNLDAWHDGETWYENDVYTSDDDIFYIQEDILSSNRKLLSFLRENHYLTDQSKGKIEVEVFPTIEYSAWICARSNHEPIFRIQQI